MAPTASLGWGARRRFELLTIVTMLFCVGCFAVQALVRDPAQRSTLLSLEVLVGKALATLGGLLGASAFGRGDYMRRAWLFIAGNYLALVIKDVVYGNALFIRSGDQMLGALHFPGIDPASVSAANGRAVLVIIGNVLAVIGTFMLARAWRVAGLELSASKWTQRLIFLAAVAIAVALSGYGTYTALLDLPKSASLRSVSVVVSDGADMISFALMAPVLLTALALRGGLLAWPWAIYVASQVGWMLFDTVSQLPVGTHLSELAMRGIIETTRILACAFGLAAGVAQRWAVQGPARE